MGDGALFWAGAIGLLVLISVAGLVYDRFHKGEHSPSERSQRRAAQTLRYNRDVGDSTNAGGGW